MSSRAPKPLPVYEYQWVDSTVDALNLAGTQGWRAVNTITNPVSGRTTTLMVRPLRAEDEAAKLS